MPRVTQQHKTYAVTITLQVHDKAALHWVATDTFRRNGTTDEDILDLIGTEVEPNIDACLIGLLDPGVSPAGTKIVYSTCDSI